MYSICIHVQKQVSSNSVLIEKNGFAPIKNYAQSITTYSSTEEKTTCKVKKEKVARNHAKLNTSAYIN